MANRIEVSGRIASAPTLRVTPAGTAVLSMVVEAGEKAGELPMPVLMTGESARAIATRLKAGVEVRVAGALRATRSRVRPAAQTSGLAGVEVIADEITLVDAAGQGLSA
ncbi:MAG TPA: single-stranded DNA-binding protein [Candidatus Binataceae bacterium]